MKRNLTISLLLAGVYAHAQLTNRVMVTNDYTSKSSDYIVIKWVSKKIKYDNGYNIYRSIEGQGNWEKLNDRTIDKIPFPFPDKYRSLPKEILQSYAIAYEKDMHYFADKKHEFFAVMTYLNMLRSQELGELLGITWTDQSAQKGVRYQYKVEGITATGATEEIGVSEAIERKAYQPLAAPDSINISRTPLAIHLDWAMDEETSVATVIERAEEGGDFEPIFDVPLYISTVEDAEGNLSLPTPKLILDDTNALATYRFRLARVDFFGQKGKYSPVITLSPKDFNPPSAAEDVQVEVDDRTKKATLRWTYTAQTPEDFKGFRVVYKDSLNGEAKALTDYMSATTLEQSVQFEENGNYLVYVATEDQSGNVSLSQPVQVKIDDFFPPAVPTDISVTQDSAFFTVRWKANQEGDLKNYYLYRYLGKQAPASKEDYTVVTPLGCDTTVFVDSLEEKLVGTLYYAVAAMDTNHNISMISASASYSVPDKIAPSTPFIKKVSTVGEAIQIVWMPTIDDDLKANSLYKITPEGDTLSFVLSASDTSFLDNDLIGGKRYQYYLSCEDLSGNRSGKSEVRLAIAPIDKEKIKQAMLPNKIKVSYIKNKKYAVISWEYGEDVKTDGIVVYKGEKKGDLRAVSGLTQKSSYIDRQVKRGETYYYQLKVFANGTKASSEAQELRVKSVKKYETDY